MTDFVMAVHMNPATRPDLSRFRGMSPVQAAHADPIKALLPAAFAANAEIDTSRLPATNSDELKEFTQQFMTQMKQQGKSIFRGIYADYRRHAAEQLGVSNPTPEQVADIFVAEATQQSAGLYRAPAPRNASPSDPPDIQVFSNEEIKEFLEHTQAKMQTHLKGLVGEQIGVENPTLEQMQEFFIEAQEQERQRAAQDPSSVLSQNHPLGSYAEGLMSSDIKVKPEGFSPTPLPCHKDRTKDDPPIVFP